jgi:general secretion pathway protein J
VNGFTLLEVLVAVMLTSLLVTALFRAFREIHEAQRRTLDQGGRERTAMVLLDRLERELLGTLLVVQGDAEEGSDPIANPWLFLGVDRTDAAQDADALRFVTRSPARAPGLQAQGGLRMVTYVAETDEAALALFRHEQPLPEGLEKELTAAREGQTVVHDLARFALRFQDEDTGEWVDAWDSSDVSRLDRLPASVEITVQLLAQDPDGEWAAGEELQRVVPLPVRPIQPAAAEESGEAQDCGEGETVAQCLARTGPGQSPTERHAYQQLSTRYGTRCFADIAGSNAQDELEQAGFDTSECR